MIAPAVALAIGGAAMGAFGGMKSAKNSKRPTITTITRRPSAELGGYNRILDALNRARDAQGYQIGQNNPYLNPVMSHIMGRAGIQAPEGGWRQPPPPGANPYLTPQTPPPDPRYDAGNPKPGLP